MAPPRRRAPQNKLIIPKSRQIDNRRTEIYTGGVRSFELPEKVKKFLVPGVVVVAILLIVGGFYFRQRSLDLVPQTTILEEEGEVSGAYAALPENFPQDIPLFTPSETLSSMESQGRIQITLQTEASAGRVCQFYQQEMEDFGWKLAGRGLANNNGALTFKKRERGTQVVITSDPGSPTLIILNTNPSPSPKTPLAR